jgi:hypothetical protein
MLLTYEVIFVLLAHYDSISLFWVEGLFHRYHELYILGKEISEMPKRISLRLTKYGKEGLILPRTSVEKLRKAEKQEKGERTDKLKEGEPIDKPISIGGQRFYVKGRADGRAVVPKKIVKKLRLRAGTYSFVFRESKARDTFTHRGYFPVAASYNMTKTRYLLENLDDYDEKAIAMFEAVLFRDMANFPKGMQSCYANINFIILLEKPDQYGRDKYLMRIPVETISSDDFRLDPVDVKSLINAAVEEAFELAFEKRNQDYVAGVIVSHYSVTFFRTTRAGEIPKRLLPKKKR